eukprot:m51a1_g2744 hypothetical protein (637) ;mRNA; r:933766-936279
MERKQSSLRSFFNVMAIPKKPAPSDNAAAASAAAAPSASPAPAPQRSPPPQRPVAAKRSPPAQAPADEPAAKRQRVPDDDVVDDIVDDEPDAPAPLAAAAQPQQAAQGAAQATWMWLGDGGKWLEYEAGVARRIEEAYARGDEAARIDEQRFVDVALMAQCRYDDPSKRRVVKRLGPPVTRPFPIDGERYVEFRDMTQVRFDDSSKRRSVRRGAPSPQGPAVAVAAAPPPKPQQQPRQQQQQQQQQPRRDSVASAAAAAAANGEEPTRWFYCLEEATNTWCEYPRDVCERLEDAVRRRLKTVKVDDERFVDTVNMLQKRFNDPTRKRYVQRGVPPNAVLLSAATAVDNPDQPSPAAPAAAAAAAVAPAGGSQEDGEETEVDDRLHEIARGNIVIDDGDQTEEDRKLQEELEANWPPKAVSDLSDTAALESMPRADRRRFYKCGNDYLDVHSLRTWQQYLDKKDREYREPFFPHSAELNEKMVLWQGDITTLEVDAIVNAAKPSLLGGGGIDGAIHRAAGHGLLDACSKLNGCAVGSAVITRGYRLPADHVIHTVGPVGEKPDLLRSCYVACLDLAAANGIRTVAFCCISTGIYGYPNKTAAHVALRAIDRIVFCVFLGKDKRLYKIYMPQYFPPAK